MLSTDVIVGFPTEDEAAFARTLAALESGLFGRVHVFAYSPRPGTAAAELPPLPAARRQGAHGARAGGRRGGRPAARRAALGREAEVLVEERRDGLWRGYSSEYVRYSLRGDARRGELVRAVADGITRTAWRGSVEGVKRMSDCIFCRIAAGEIPAEVVAEDDEFVAFRDAQPAGAGARAGDPARARRVAGRGRGSGRGASARALGFIAATARSAGVAESGYRVITNTGPDAGQEVMHLHWHVIGGTRLGGMA